MPTTRHRSSAATGALCIALVLVCTSCASSSAGELAIPATAQTTSGDLVAEGIPGSEEFGLTMDGLARRIEQVEASIGTCMASAGFEYVPVEFDTIRQAQAADKSVPGVNNDDFLAQYGFGLTTLFDRPNTMVEVAKGQNAAILAGLASADQVAYRRTLLGENPDSWFVVGLEDEDFSETGGCTRSAVERFFSADETAGTYVNPGDILIEDDPRMVGALAEWAQCLAVDGHDYDHPDDLEDDLVDQLDAIVGDSAPGALAGESLDALRELQGFERAVAPLAEDCEDEFIALVEEAIEIELYGAPQG